MSGKSIRSKLARTPASLLALAVITAAWFRSASDTVQQLFLGPCEREGIFMSWHLPSQQLGGAILPWQSAAPEIVPVITTNSAVASADRFESE